MIIMHCLLLSCRALKLIVVGYTREHTTIAHILKWYPTLDAVDCSRPFDQGMTFASFATTKVERIVDGMWFIPQRNCVCFDVCGGGTTKKCTQ